MLLSISCVALDVTYLLWASLFGTLKYKSYLYLFKGRSLYTPKAPLELRVLRNIPTDT